jgi:hypothetical protein
MWELARREEVNSRYRSVASESHDNQIVSGEWQRKLS